MLLLVGRALGLAACAGPRSVTRRRQPWEFRRPTPLRSDVDPAGVGEIPVFRDDTIVLGMGQRAIVEFTRPTF